MIFFSTGVEHLRFFCGIGFPLMNEKMNRSLMWQWFDEEKIHWAVFLIFDGSSLLIRWGMKIYQHNCIDLFRWFIRNVILDVLHIDYNWWSCRRSLCLCQNSKAVARSIRDRQTCSWIFSLVNVDSHIFYNISSSFSTRIYSTLGCYLFTSAREQE